MSTRHQPPGDDTSRLSDRDLADVVGRAQRIAQQERAGHSPAEVAQVAAELDLPAAHVATALAEHQQDKQTTLRASETRREGWRLRGLAILAVVGACALAAVATAAWSAGDVSRATDDLVAARARYIQSLDRQSRTISTLVTAAGGHDPAFERAPTVFDSLDLARREAYVAELARAAARAVAALPAAQSPATEQQRLSLSYELTGAENRSAVERARHAGAQSHWQQTSGGLGGRLAIWLGLARAPE